MTSTWFCAFLVVLLSFGSAFGENVIISTMLGDVMGVQKSNYVEFDGIAYTENAPVGQYRLAQSVMRTSVYSDAVYDATYYRPACIQASYSTVSPQSEDCLYLNIQSPNIDMNGTVSTDLLPVMVWIHGGGHLTGSAFEYDGRPFLRESNVVFVSINYRLAVLGFLALQSIHNESNGTTTGGMNGMYDQIVALQWIQTYIEDFGGDSQRVTIFGESAGGFSACWLSLMPLAAGLFDQAIIQSGHCSAPWSTQRERDDSIASSMQYLANSGLSDDLDELRAVNVSFFSNWEYTFPWPSVDGYLLQTTTHDMLINDDYTLNPDKVIIGSNSLDSLEAFPWFFSFNPLSTPPTNDVEFEGYLRQYISDDSDIDLLANTYYPLADFPSTSYNGATFTNQEMRWNVMNADVCFICSTMYYLHSIMNNANSGLSEDDVYLYNFIGPETPNYIPHGADVPYLFWNSSVPLAIFGVAEDESLADFMINAWTNFGVYGVPNSTLNEEQWVPFGVNQTAMILGNDGANAYNGYNVAQFDSKGYRNGACDFWLNSMGYDVIISLCQQQYTLTPTESPTVEPTAFESTEERTTEDDESAARQTQAGVSLVLAVVYYFFLFCISCCPSK
eukprot:CAMPEP_0197027944 /NCGR_PEP_ID=MMETSP1384-20130603/7791_1 /TAXON_ID=29189 /ORGANISM="Ammonia sp." /LENGTH=615 /DNA_ID=CAMNT_0042456873 /DNA_START=37 /DNA_END=1884 /DNA_ORIENTATION=+